MISDVRSDLTEIVHGIRSDIFKSYEIINLLQMINKNASSINKSRFGIFFARLQNILREQIILLLSKMYEKPDEYPLKNIPAAIKLIEENKKAFIMIESKDETVLLLLKKLGHKYLKMDDTITEIFLKRWQNHIGEMKSIRRNIETIRNKYSAHHENIDVSSLPDVTLPEIIDLLDRAKTFVSIIDSVYLELTSVDCQGQYIVNLESKNSSIILKNLLVKANIIDAQQGREIASTLFD